MDLLMRYIVAVMGAIVVLCFALLIVTAGLAPEVENRAEDLVGYGGPHSDEPLGNRSLFHTGVPIGGRKSGETYGAFSRRRDAIASSYYHGFGCIDSCKANEAGFLWAMAHHIRRPRHCVGPSWAFVEGCASFVLPDNSEAAH